MKKKGFTLIELLVVISIIALLLSILMPSLGKVKNIARTTMCAANMKQIGTITALYQADHDDELPILFNKYTTGFNARARFSFLSIAMRDYVQMKSAFGTGKTTGMSFDGFWDGEASLLYTLECAPKFFVCPFARNKKVMGETISEGQNTLTADGSGTPYDLLRQKGYIESYATWLWPYDSIKKGSPGTHPYGIDHGKPKYKNMNWYNAKYFAKTNTIPMGRGMDFAKNIKLNSEYSNISEKTLLFCSQGEWLVGVNDMRMFNYKSHSKGKYGGTNTLFGDSHVGWVQGSQIGWP